MPDAFGKSAVKLLPFLQVRFHNEQESLLLAQLRDALLPRLLSGEIRVRDAERIASVAL